MARHRSRLSSTRSRYGFPGLGESRSDDTVLVRAGGEWGLETQSQPLFQYRRHEAGAHQRGPREAKALFRQDNPHVEQGILPALHVQVSDPTRGVAQGSQLPLRPCEGFRAKEEKVLRRALPARRAAGPPPDPRLRGDHAPQQDAVAPLLWNGYLQRRRGKLLQDPVKNRLTQAEPGWLYALDPIGWRLAEGSGTVNEEDCQNRHPNGRTPPQKSRQITVDASGRVAERLPGSVQECISPSSALSWKLTKQIVPPSGMCAEGGTPSLPNLLSTQPIALRYDVQEYGVSWEGGRLALQKRLFMSIR